MGSVGGCEPARGKGTLWGLSAVRFPRRRPLRGEGGVLEDSGEVGGGWDGGGAKMNFISSNLWLSSVKLRGALVEATVRIL